MSLWLQAATEALESGAYERLRVRIMPHAPIPIPGCMFRELEFAERRCRDVSKDRLFPIRFIWLMEAKEQRMFGLEPMGRSLYNPEKLLAYWERILAEPQYRLELEAAGFQFDLNEKAVKLEAGWIYIGPQFVEDFLEIETTAGVSYYSPTRPKVRGGLSSVNSKSNALVEMDWKAQNEINTSGHDCFFKIFPTADSATNKAIYSSMPLNDLTSQM